MDESMGKQEFDAARNDVRQKQIQSQRLPIGGFKTGITKAFGHNKATEQGLRGLADPTVPQRKRADLGHLLFHDFPRVRGVQF